MRKSGAGSKGLAISITIPADAERLSAIEAGLTQPLTWGNIDELNKTDTKILLPEMVTLCLSAGRKDKIRPGDILGALTKDAGLAASTIGKIDNGALYSYVAIHKSQVDKAYHYLQNGKLKNRKVNVKKLSTLQKR